MVKGATLAGIISAHLLANAGFRVAVVDRARRICADHYLIPVSGIALREVQLRCVNDAILTATESVEVKIAGKEEMERPAIRTRVLLLDAAKLGESLITSCEVVTFLWSEIKDVVHNGDSVSLTLSSPISRKLILKTHLLIDTSPQTRGLCSELSTGTFEGYEDVSGAVLTIAPSGANILIAHGKLSTVATLGSPPPVTSRIATSRFYIGEVHSSIGSLEDRTLKVAEAAGHVSPPWLGDSMLLSGKVALLACKEFFKSSRPSEVESLYKRLAERSNNCTRLIKYALDNSLLDSPVSQIVEAIEPSWPHET